MKRTLVIGYGNTLRGDDGAGVRATEMIRERNGSVDCLTLPELVPELAETLSKYERAVFVDASSRVQSVSRRTIRPEVFVKAQHSHALTPEVLSGLAHSLFGYCPKELELIEIPAREFGYDERLSAQTSAAVCEVVASFRSTAEL